VDAVRAWLKRIGLSEGDLECGAQMPMFEGSAHPLIRAGRQPSAAHNNCSGKHTGFLTVAVHRGYPTKGYIRPDHPVQRDLLRLFEEICDADLGATPRGIDGCGIPVFGLTLRQMALGLARLADPSRLAPERAEACRRIQAAVPAHPVMIAGTGRFDTAVLSAVGRDLIVKGGAEGVHAAALPTKGLGVAIKIEDGAGRASQAAVAATLDRLGAFTPEQTTALASTLAPGLRNWVGTSVGEIRPAADFPF
jgi:L-asparaginase II